MGKTNIRLSLAQITYLENIQKFQEKDQKCPVGKVAALSGVTHAPVSRFLKSCMEQGYVDEQNYLTEEGKKLLQRQQQLLRDVTAFVQELGMTGEEQSQGIRNMLEQMEPSLLTLILERENKRRQLKLAYAEQMDDGNIPAVIVEDLIPNGSREVEFHLLRSGGQEGLSMADRGFEHPAYLKKDRSGAWLELRCRKMQERSGKNGHMMTGQLETMRYEHGGILTTVKMEGDMLSIPLKAFHMARENRKKFKGSLDVRVTCTVGTDHMPENTAQLVIWL